MRDEPDPEPTNAVRVLEPNEEHDPFGEQLAAIRDAADRDRIDRLIAEREQQLKLSREG